MGYGGEPRSNDSSLCLEWVQGTQLLPIVTLWSSSLAPCNRLRSSNRSQSCGLSLTRPGNSSQSCVSSLGSGGVGDHWNTSSSSSGDVAPGSQRPGQWFQSREGGYGLICARCPPAEYCRPVVAPSIREATCSTTHPHRPPRPHTLSPTLSCRSESSNK